MLELAVRRGAELEQASVTKLLLPGDAAGSRAARHERTSRSLEEGRSAPASQTVTVQMAVPATTAHSTPASRPLAVVVRRHLRRAALVARRVRVAVPPARWLRVATMSPTAVHAQPGTAAVTRTLSGS